MFDKQKANFDNFNEFKNTYLEHYSEDFKYLPGQKTGWCVNSSKYGRSLHMYCSLVCLGNGMKTPIHIFSSKKIYSNLFWKLLFRPVAKRR